jgi:hypothetical protein
MPRLQSSITSYVIACAVLLAAAWPAPAAAADPIYAGAWSSKEPGGTGGLFTGLTWDQLVARWKELGKGQYLADVEVYEVNGQQRFAALWRVGPGNGALLLTTWDKFDQAWRDRWGTQDLIDLEIVETKSGRMFLGVWRYKQGGETGTGALWVGLTWDELLARRAELGGAQYLADVETYVSGNQRLFAAVWRVGPGNGAFYLKSSWAELVELKRSLDRSQELLDFEVFQTRDGAWRFLGVWRRSDRAGPLHASTSSTAFEPLSRAELLAHWKRLQPTRTLIDLEVMIPVPTPLVALRGDTTCKYGDPDCNRCAAQSVTRQFERAFAGGWSSGSWTFRGNDRYPPDGMKPEAAFNPYEAALVQNHIQGLVQTSSSRFPYAGSHSHKSTGSIFIVERKGNDLVLHSLYRSSHHHPSGVAVLGDGLFVAEGGMLRRFSISAAGTQQSRRFEIPTTDPRKKGLEGAGGGLGLAKLYDGTTLLVVSAPGGGFRPGTLKAARDDNQRPRYTRFYRLVPDAFGGKPEVVFLGEWPHEGEAARPSSPRAYSENLSVITECNTGTIYTIHTTGDYKLRGNGYWRLSRVELGPRGPRLVHVATRSQAQHNERCHHRSSATARVGPTGRLELLCSERAVIKWHPTGRFSFRRGTS